MASVAAGRDEKAFECYPAETEGRTSRLRTGYPGHGCPTDTGPQGSRRLETQPWTTSMWDFAKWFPLHRPSIFVLSRREAHGAFADWGYFEESAQETSWCHFPSPRYQVGRRWGGGGQVPHTYGATQEAQISTGRSEKLTVSQPFALVLIYLAFYWRLCFIACRDFGQSRGSLSSRHHCYSRNNHDLRSSSPSQALIYLYGP